MFRKLVLYIRSLFCAHDWEYIGKTNIFETENSKLPHTVIHVWRCKKCGYIQKEKI